VPFDIRAIWTFTNTQWILAKPVLCWNIHSVEIHESWSSMSARSRSTTQSSRTTWSWVWFISCIIEGDHSLKSFRVTWISERPLSRFTEEVTRSPFPAVETRLDELDFAHFCEYVRAQALSPQRARTGGVASEGSNISDRKTRR
jgi:hypothetical protein